MLPASITSLTLRFEEDEECLDLTPLIRLVQLVTLHLMSPIGSAIPQLPALSILQVTTADLQALAPVTATLEVLFMDADDIDFGQPYTLVHFTCLTRLDVEAARIRNFKPEVLPPP